MRYERRLRASDADRVRDELLALAGSWRRVLADDPIHARPIVSSLLTGRVTIEPMKVARKRWILSGQGTIVGLFKHVVFPGMREVFSRGYSVPNGIRTRVLALKGPRPRPLDDGDVRGVRPNLERLAQGHHVTGSGQVWPGLRTAVEASCSVPL